MKVRELEVFTVRIEREKLAKDAKSIITIFQVLENCNIPCECVAINIDWLAITIQQSEYSKIFTFVQEISKALSGVNVKLDDHFMLIAVEEFKFTSRMVGLILRVLALHEIDVRMVRQIKNNQKLVIGFDYEDVLDAKEIIKEELEYFHNEMMK